MDLNQIYDVFNPVITADSDTFTMETVLVKKISGEIIHHRDFETVQLFDLKTNIVDKIIELSEKTTIRLPKNNLISRLVFNFYKSSFIKKITKSDSEFYLISKNLNDELKKVGFNLESTKSIARQDVIIISSTNKFVINPNSNKIWFDYTKFKVILIK